VFIKVCRRVQPIPQVNNVVFIPLVVVVIGASCRSEPAHNAVSNTVCLIDSENMDNSIYVACGNLSDAAVLFKGLKFAFDFLFENQLRRAAVAVPDAAAGSPSPQSRALDFQLVCGECAQRMSVPPAAKKIKCPNCESVYVKKRPRSAEDQLTVNFVRLPHPSADRPWKYALKLVVVNGRQCEVSRHLDPLFVQRRTFHDNEADALEAGLRSDFERKKAALTGANSSNYTVTDPEPAAPPMPPPASRVTSDPREIFTQRPSEKAEGNAVSRVPNSHSIEMMSLDTCEAEQVPDDDIPLPALPVHATLPETKARAPAPSNAAATASPTSLSSGSQSTKINKKEDSASVRVERKAAPTLDRKSSENSTPESSQSRNSLRTHYKFNNKTPVDQFVPVLESGEPMLWLNAASLSATPVQVSYSAKRQELRWGPGTEKVEGQVIALKKVRKVAKVKPEALASMPYANNLCFSVETKETTFTGVCASEEMASAWYYALGALTTAVAKERLARKSVNHGSI